MQKKLGERFYGTATVGERGQIVIPAEARGAMKLRKGDKLLAFGMGKDMIALSPLSNVERFATHLAKRLELIRAIIRKSGPRRTR